MPSYTYTTYPYRVEFPDSSEGPRNCKSLEDALRWARWRAQSVWKEDGKWGRAGEPTTDADTAVVTNRNSGYRWFLRREQYEVEFRTPEMVEEVVGNQHIEVFLTVEEAEALARAAKAAEIKDRRTKTLAEQALDQIAAICRQVRDRVRAGDKVVDRWARSIPRRAPFTPEVEEQSQTTQEFRKIETPRPSYRPLGDPDNLSLKEAGEILGKARNTVHLWYRQGKFPPAVNVGSPPTREQTGARGSPLPARSVARGRTDAEHPPGRLRLSRAPRASLGMLDREEGSSAQGHSVLGGAARVDDRSEQGREADLRRGP